MLMPIRSAAIEAIAQASLRQQIHTATVPLLLS